MKESINVLSLFDGVSCGIVALERAGIKVNKYFASEVDKYAIKISQKNYPNIIQIGDIKKVSYKDGVLHTENGNFIIDFDLIIGGSPCQGFSFAGKQLNFEDPRSKLYFEWLRLAHETCAPYFFLENVRMKKEFQNIISGHLGVEPVFLNSNLVSAQNRLRLYWTNIPGYIEPEDKGILLKDIVHENVDLDLSAIRANGKAHCLTANYRKHGGIVDITKSYTKSNGSALFEVESKLKLSVPEATKKGYTEGKVGDGIDLTFLNSKTRRGRLMEHKSNCLTATAFDYNIIEELKQYIVPFDKTLRIIEKEVEKGKVGFFRKDSQANRVYYIHDKAITLCGDSGGGAAKMGQYLFGCITPDRVNKRQNGQRFSEGKKFYTLTAQDQHGILIEGYIRKLTPIECERLQTLPDGYTEGASNSQRYKMLGNGWTVDAIVCFFKNLK